VFLRGQQPGFARIQNYNKFATIIFYQAFLSQHLLQLLKYTVSETERGDTKRIPWLRKISDGQILRETLWGSELLLRVMNTNRSM
jgi:hypothetical protein